MIQLFGHRSIIIIIIVNIIIIGSIIILLQLRPSQLFLHVLVLVHEKDNGYDDNTNSMKLLKYYNQCINNRTLQSYIFLYLYSSSSNTLVEVRSGYSSRWRYKSCHWLTHNVFLVQSSSRVWCICEISKPDFNGMIRFIFLLLFLFLLLKSEFT